MTRRNLNKTTCWLSAKQYNGRAEFARQDIAAYQKALDQGWLDEWFPKRKHGPYSQFTYAVCERLAAQCHTRHEFKKLSYQAWDISRKNKWLDIFASKYFISTSERIKAVTTKYSDDEVKAVALKFTRLQDFRRNEPAMAEVAYKRDLISSFTWLSRNTELAGNTSKIDNIYVYEFEPIRYVYVGRTIEPNARDIAHRTIKTDTVYKFAQAHQIAIPQCKYIHKGLTPNEGARLEIETMEKYKASGWKLVNKMPGGGLGGLNLAKPKSHYINITKKYTRLADLIKYNKNLYWKLKTLGWLDECVWLKRSKAVQNLYDTLDKCKDAANQCADIADFKKRFRGAYNQAYSKHWMDVLFPNRRNPNKPVGVYALDGKTLLYTFKNAIIAANSLGLKEGTIRACLRGQQKTHDGKIFKYLSE